MIRRTIVALLTALAVLFGGAVAAQAAPAPTPSPGNSHNVVGYASDGTPITGFSSDSPSAAAVDECEDLRGVCLYDGNYFNGDWYFINMPNTRVVICFNLHPVGWGDRANTASVNGPGPRGRSYASFHRHTGCNSILDPPEYLLSYGLTTGLENNVTSSVEVVVNDP